MTVDMVQRDAGARTAQESAPRRRRWRFRASARVRILGWFVVLVAIAMASGLLLQRSILRAQLDGQVDEQLQQEVDELRELAIEGRNPDTGELFNDDARAIFDTFLSRNLPVEGEALFTMVDDQPYRFTITPLQLFDDPEVVAEWAAITAPTWGEFDTSEGDVRYLAVPLRAGGEVAGIFIVVNFLDAERARIDSALQVGAYVYGAAFLVACVLAWLAAGRVLRPIRLLTNTARSITDDNWSERIPVRGDDEIVDLARTFNDMLDRLEEAFAIQRRFIDDAGHELRTPITIIRGNLELVGDDPAERARVNALVLDELDRMARMVDDLLLLAKSGAPGFLSISTVHIGELTHELAAKAAALGDRGWAVEEATQVVIVGDRQRLTQAVMNLARNTIEHTPPGTRVTFGSRLVGDTVHIWVRDDGPGIPYEEQEHVFARFARGVAGRRRTEGAGLGLAIVRAVAIAHGGRVDLQSTPGTGTTFTLILPVDGDEGGADEPDPDR